MSDLNYSRDEWAMDWEINRVGIPVDLSLTQSALNLWGKEKLNIHDQLLRLTNMEKVTRNTLLGWLSRQGLYLENTQKEYLGKLLLEMRRKGQEHEPLFQVLQLWTEYGGRSVDKFSAIQRCVEPDGRIRGVFQFGGASRTLRWAGRYLQPHNLRSTMVEPDEEAGETWDGVVDALVSAIHSQDPGYLKANFGHIGTVPQLLGSAVRHAVLAPEGSQFAVNDLSSIESVVVGWVTDCTAINDAIAHGKDTYKLFAAEYFGVPYDEVTKAQRKFSKPPVLGCAYQLWWEGLIDYADGMGVLLQDEEAERAVKTWRKMHPEVVDSWKWLVTTVCDVTEYKTPMAEGYKVKIYRDQDFLYIRLPSGRELSYYHPEVRYEENEKWGTVRRNFCYKGVNQYTGRWGTVYSHGGKLCILKGTKVLTSAGWQAIEEIQPDTEVWDGEKWVVTQGAILQGHKETMEAFGVSMTPDHLVLTTRGWRRASESEGHQRAESRLPHGRDLCWERWEEIPVVDSLHLRQQGKDACHRVQKVAEEKDLGLLRVQAKGVNRKEKHAAWESEAPNVCRVAEHDRQVSTSLPSGVGELRRARHQGMPSVAEVLPDFLGRYEPDLPTRPNPGKNMQLERVFSEQLRVERLQSSGKKPEREHLRDYADRAEASGGYFRRVRDQEIYAEVSTAARGLVARHREEGRCKEPVYDLLNCGPDHRFVVQGEDGRPLIVHNCENIVQAIARDILAHGMLLFHQNYQPWARIFLHVHDEIAAEVYQASAAEEILAMLNWCMVQTPAWAPDILLKSAGYTAPRYRKE